MKIHIKNLCLLPALIAALTIATGLPAQTFTTLYSFTAAPGSYPYVNSDGANPVAGLILSGNTLYGTAANGGNAGYGTVFAINTDGTVFTNLHSCNLFGAIPEAGLILSGDTLYGTALTGSKLGYGTVFAVNTNGTGFTNLYNFTGTSTGANPHGGLTLSGSTLYGTTSAGGSVAGSGTVFAISTSGIGITNLHKFVANTDGSNPYAGLVLSGNTLYGTASSGGSGQGTLFRVNTDSTSFTNLHNFTYINDGAFPQGDLILSGNTLYGTTANGGTSATGNGTVFAINTDGTGFTNLYSFTAMAFDPNYTPTNSDGANPYAGLVLSGNTLYGTTSAGGMNGSGTVFAVKTDGTGFTNLYTFTALDPDTGTNSDGANSRAGLVLSSNTLYGTASSGGVNGNGTVFSLSVGTAASPPQLTINLSGTNVLLTWLAAGFILQSTTNLALPVWMTVPGQNTVTNPISGIQKFYRLSQ